MTAQLNDPPPPSLPPPAAKRERHPNPPPRVTRLLDSRRTLLLGWAGLVLGAPFVWWHPPLETLVDAALAPVAAVLLFVVVDQWAGRRSAVAAAGFYLILLVVSLTMLNSPQAGLAARNLNCASTPQLLVGLGGICLLEHLAISPLLWAVVMLAASDFQPQFAFIPLLMMTLLRSRTLLVIGFVDKARGAALRAALLCLLGQYLSRYSGLGLIRLDSITLPLSWWIASWLLDGEALMPFAARVLITGILCVATVADFRAWPAMGLILLAAYVVGAPSRHARVPSTP